MNAVDGTVPTLPIMTPGGLAAADQTCERSGLGQRLQALDTARMSTRPADLAPNGSRRRGAALVKIWAPFRAGASEIIRAWSQRVAVRRGRIRGVDGQVPVAAHAFPLLAAPTKYSNVIAGPGLRCDMKGMWSIRDGGSKLCPPE